MNGLIVINKPLGISSMDVIRKLRRITQIKKIGHNGTLDPLATGVMLVCIGPATKKIRFLMGLDKTYTTTIDLSATSTTEDLEGIVTPYKVEKIPTQEDIEKVLPQFLGTITQIPPRFSAIKIQGKRAYKQARNDATITVPPRMVTINSIQITNYAWPHLELFIDCQTGTYIRSLGRDIGKALQTGGYLTKLERTSIGKYTIDQAIFLDNITSPDDIKLIDISREFDKY